MRRMKLFAVLAALLVLTSCGKPAAEFDPAALSKALMDSDAFSEVLEPLDADLIGGFYGVGGDIADGAAYSSTGATAEEIVVLNMGSKSDADAAYKALEKRVADQKEACADYLPLELPKLDNAIVKQQGNSVLLVVAANADAATKVLAAG